MIFREPLIKTIGNNYFETDVKGNNGDTNILSGPNANIT